MDSRARDAVLVLRLWAEPDDPIVRGRLLCEAAKDGILALGVDAILDAVETEIRAFARDEHPGNDGR